MGETEKQGKRFLMKYVLFFVVIAIAALIIWLILNNGKEVKTSTSVSNIDTSLLNCTYTQEENAFFVSRTSIRHEHLIKAMAKGDTISEMVYNYDATYNSEKVAEDEDAKMHADYNFYMRDNNIDAESLNPVFSPVKEKDKITLYLKMEKLNAVTGKLFFLSPEEISDIRTKKDFSIHDLERIYKSKGFSCEYVE